jgi:hypothetical protein
LNNGKEASDKTENNHSDFEFFVGFGGILFEKYPGGDA